MSYLRRKSLLSPAERLDCLIGSLDRCSGLKNGQVYTQRRVVPFSGPRLVRTQKKLLQGHLTIYCGHYALPWHCKAPCSLLQLDRALDGR
jgi:hypothetical protein